MSALGQKLPRRLTATVSALPPKADNAPRRDLTRWARYHHPMPSPRRFPPPWSVEELDACFVVPHCGQVLAYVRLYTFHTKPILFNRALRLADILFFFTALHRNPISKSEISFAVLDRYATVSLASLEFQQGRKAPLPSKVSPAPNKTYPVEPSFAFHG
jgi:hypothetical protein